MKQEAVSFKIITMNEIIIFFKKKGKRFIATF